MPFDRIRSVLGLAPDETDTPAADLDRVGERETVSDRIDHDAWSRQLPDSWSIRFDIEPSVDERLEEIGIVSHPDVDWVVVVAPTSERTVTVNRRFPSGAESRLFSASTPETALARLTDRLPEPSTVDASSQSNKNTISSKARSDDSARSQVENENADRSNLLQANSTDRQTDDHTRRRPDQDQDSARAD